MSETNQSIGIGALALVTAGIATFALSPIQPPAAAPIRTAVIASTSDQSETAQFPLGDAGVSLANQIDEAVAATDWPELSPSMDDAIKGPQTPSYISPCGQVERPAVESCTWGEQSAPKTIMVLGDSVAMTYIEPLKYFAENSAGEWKVRNEAMFGCTFVDIAMRDEGDKFGAACPDRKAGAIRAVNELRPEIVVISNRASTHTAGQWTAGMKALTDQLVGAGKIVFLSAPPSDINIGECYDRLSSPAECVGGVTDTWLKRAGAEEKLAASISGSFVDSRRWFCTPDGYCPSFVGTTPTKKDMAHMTPEYARLMSPAFAETFASVVASGQ